MIQELRRLLCAVQFMTRLPTPNIDWRPDSLARSARYFPLVGLLTGGLSALALVLARMIWRDGPLPALLAVGVGVLVTGALHEDGLADVADGLGGGQTRERRLAIMKDSRLGVYGALALGLVLAVKVAALAEVRAPLAAAAALISAHVGGRAVAAAGMTGPYAADPAASKLPAVDRGVRPWEASVALLIGAVVIGLLMRPAAGLACAVAGLAAAAVPLLAARRLIGGQTGDVLGAAEQAFEAGFILAAAALASSGWPHQ